MITYLSPGLCGFFYVLFFSAYSIQAAPPVPNPRLSSAYNALQAWKRAMMSDPNHFTSNWNSQDVCSYNGVYCASAPDNRWLTTVAGIDLNEAGITGSLPEALGQLTDLAFFHISSNNFSGTIPGSFRNLRLLYELDVSINQFSGGFPKVVLNLPALVYLDLRFNCFSGSVPSRLFDMELDAIFLNDNNFQSTLPENIGNSRVSALVMANNNLKGCFPSTIARMAGTLEEIILSNSGITGCLPSDIGHLSDLTVFDVSSNKLVGSLPETIGNMKSLEQLNVANNRLSGGVPTSICSLNTLANFTFSDNFFSSEPQSCLKLADKDDKKNCVNGCPSQRSTIECSSFHSHSLSCAASGCSAVRSSSPTVQYNKKWASLTPWN